MNTRSKQAFLFLLAITFAASGFGQTPVPSSVNTLIVPGKSIGKIQLGANAKDAKALKALGKPDGADTAMGGKEAKEWYLGAHPGDKGRPFHQPGEIGINTLMDVDKESAAHPAPEVIVKIYTTSPRFHTAGGIAPGSTLEAIRKKFPRIQPDGADNDDESAYWPGHGKMNFYIDIEMGIVFSIRDSDGVCVEIDVVRAGTKETDQYPPMASGDYVIDDLDGKIGEDIKLGMTAPKLLALLGRPGAKAGAGDESDGSVWRWRLPAQGKDEPPGLNIFLWKLPDGTLIADQIELTSPAFVLDDTIHPGSPFKDILADSSHISKLKSQKNEVEAVDIHLSSSRKVVMMPQPKNQKNDSIDIYGDLENGFLFDIRKSDSVCTSISILPAPLDIHSGLNMREEGAAKTHK